MNARTSARNAFSSGVKRRSMARPRCVLINLKQAGGAHAAADAHGNDCELGAAPLTLDQRVAGHARAAHAVRVADRDRAAVDVEPLLRNAEPVAAIQHLAGERLVELPQIDIADLEPLPGQQFRYGENRANAHLVRLAAGDGEAAEGAERLQPAALGELGVHDHASRRAIRELAGIAGGDPFSLAHRLERRESLERSVRAVAFVAL